MVCWDHQSRCARMTSHSPRLGSVRKARTMRVDCECPFLGRCSSKCLRPRETLDAEFGFCFHQDHLAIHREHVLDGVKYGGVQSPKIRWSMCSLPDTRLCVPGGESVQKARMSWSHTEQKHEQVSILTVRDTDSRQVRRVPWWRGEDTYTWQRSLLPDD